MAFIKAARFFRRGEAESKEPFLKLILKSAKAEGLSREPLKQGDGVPFV
jgi:hypothetical protein